MTNDIEKTKLLKSIAMSLVDAELKVNKIENQLKEAKESARIIREETLPSLMHELGYSEFVLEDGTKIKIVQEFYASLAQGKKENDEDFVKRKRGAFDWLVENNHGGLIKTKVMSNFSRDEYDEAKKLFSELSKSGYDVEFNENIHPMTLKAFLNEQVKLGAKIPLDLFSASVVNVAKIK